MIDIQSKVVDTIFNAVKAEFPNADISTGFDEKTAIFPCVVVEEVDNVPYRKTNTDDCAENYSRITYEVSVYTNSLNSAKTDGRRIIDVADAALQSLKFRRIRLNKPLNIARTIFCQYLRSDVIVSQPVTDGETTTYYLYRR